MARGRGILKTKLCAAALAWGLSCASAASGQEASTRQTSQRETSVDDAAARQYFEQGRAAFERADYEAALVYFRHAYRLSPRGELQYNIGVAADRLQHEDEALEAFERYLDEAEHPEREAEVRGRMEALKRSIAERKATELALEEAKARGEARSDSASDRRRIDKSAIAGASALAALGAAGVTAMSIGLAKNGSCARELNGVCVTEHSATGWTAAYGAVGAAALVGSATWLVVSAKRNRGATNIEVSLSPTRVTVSGSF